MISIDITNPGSGYTSAPAVSLSGGGGTGATARAVMKVCPQGCTMLTRHGTRLVAWGNPDLPDAVYFSMLLDGTQWEHDGGGLASATIRIGGGDGDPIVGCLSWTNFTLLVFKQNSTWAIQADPQAAPADWTIQQIHRSIGCKSRRTIAQVGQDVFFLSNNGVQSVQKQLATDNNEIPVAMSYNVQDVLDGMNWPAAGKAAACFDSNFYTLWIPTASNTEPDTALVFHYLTGGWSVFTGVTACELLAMPYGGRTRLVLGMPTGEVREWLNYLQEGEDADMAYLDGAAAADLSSRVITRALTFDEPVCPKSGFYAEIEVVLTGCALQVYAVRDGGDAELLLSTTLPSGALSFPLTFPKWRERLEVHAPPRVGHLWQHDRESAANTNLLDQTRLADTKRGMRQITRQTLGLEKRYAPQYAQLYTNILNQVNPGYSDLYSKLGQRVSAGTEA